MTSRHQNHSYVLVTKDGAIELAENEGGKFKRYWKQIAKYGEFVDPRGSSKPMVIDRNLAEKFVANFKSGVRGFIPVPLGHPTSDAELADMNRGELVDMEARNDGLYGLIEIRDPQTAEKIDNKLIIDDSIAFDDDYQDKSTGKWVGPTIKHVGLVVNPYLKGMTRFQPALADGDGAAILFSDSETSGNGNNNKEENTMGKVTNNREFPVEVKYTLDNSETVATIEPGAVLEVPDDQVEAVAKQIADAVAAGPGDEELSEEQKKEKALADREAAAEAKERELAEKERALSEKNAEAKFAALLSEGKVVPAQKEAFIALSSQSDNTVELSDGKKKSVSTLLSEFLSKIPKGFKLSEEEGVSGGDKDDVELTSEEKSLTEFGLTEEDLKETKKQEGAK